MYYKDSSETQHKTQTQDVPITQDFLVFLNSSVIFFTKSSRLQLLNESLQPASLIIFISIFVCLFIYLFICSFVLGF